MSADNGYILRRDANGQYVLQMYFASAEDYPDVNDARAFRFNTLEEAVLKYEELEAKTYPYSSEYGLSVKVTPERNRTMEEKYEQDSLPDRSLESQEAAQQKKRDEVADYNAARQERLAGQDELGERAAAGQSPELPDRAQEKLVDVPQNEAPVEDRAPDATPTDAGTVPSSDTGTADSTATP